MERMTKEEAEEIKNSTYWSFILKELEYRIQLEISKLRACKKQEVLDIINTNINMLEDIKRLPQDVIERET